MNVLQAEKLRDLINFLEKQGAKGIKVTYLNDMPDLLKLNVEFESWRKEKGEGLRERKV
jgi:hypothetical protein